VRLSAATLDRLPGEVARPGYDRRAVRRGVVHLGIGAFHRAHQAVLFDAALAAGDLRWGVTGVSLRSAGVRDQLAPQDGLYTVVVRDGAAERVQLVGAVLDVLVAPGDPAAVVAAIAHPDTHLVTLTVTEKGYKLDRVAGGLDRGDADVVHDLAHPASPRTAPGLVAAGLIARHSAGAAPITVMSCDNLPHNGALLRDAVLAFAQAQDAAAATWIAAEVAFPASMVDRIVPATTAEDVAALAARIGLDDEGTVKTEPFLQWVIEDRFAGPRPDFAALGAQLTDRVAPWEDAKLRLLNGAHSAIAYLGGLAGDGFVHQFVARAEGRALVAALWDESVATLSPVAGLDVPAYREELMARFANPALQHRTRQIAMDGSQKLPQRLFRPLAERRRMGLDSPALTLAIAAWMRWQDGRTDAGETFAIDDPAAAELAAADGVDGYLAVLGEAVGDADRAAIGRWLSLLEANGALPTIALLTGEQE
jgi:fructuronate reductase